MASLSSGRIFLPVLRVRLLLEDDVESSVSPPSCFLLDNGGTPPPTTVARGNGSCGVLNGGAVFGVFAEERDPDRFSSA